ncbi:MAG: ATP-binding cassette domain-containing protein [Alphaproteobacteria bacterium]|nr:ATP-binding cassette domain-containing protein [Alphaproteobacteria bacterium]
MFCAHDLVITRERCTLKGSFSFQKGDRIGFYAPSGTGKTTLLEAIAGFLPLDQGHFTLDGQNFSTVTPAKRPVSYLFQEGFLFEHLTVFKNAALAFGKTRLPEKEAQDIKDLLQKVSLGGVLGAKANTLSGGQKQRLGVARCLLQKKEILLLDEPFNGIDADTKKVLYDLLHEQNDTCLLFTTHHKEELSALATSVLTLDNNVLRHKSLDDL